MRNQQFEMITELPEFLETGEKQIPLSELEQIHQKDLRELTTERLKQIAESASNGADVSTHALTEQPYAIKNIVDGKEDVDGVKKSAKDMHFLLTNGKFTVSAKNATSIVIATKVFYDVSQGKLEVNYHDYQHVLIAMSVDFQGNASTAQTLNKIFLTWGNISIEMANNKARVSYFEMLYNQSTQYIAEREVIAESEEDRPEYDQVSDESDEVSKDHPIDETPN